MDSKVTYRRARWKHWIRFPVLLLLLLLNFSLLMTTISHWQLKAHTITVDLASWLVVIFFNATVLVPLLLEADSISISPEQLEIQLLLWKSKFDWSQVRGCSVPLMLTYAILKTPKCIYLINKRDIASFKEIVDIIRMRLARYPKT